MNNLVNSSIKYLLDFLVFERKKNNIKVSTKGFILTRKNKYDLVSATQAAVNSQLAINNTNDEIMKGIRSYENIVIESFLLRINNNKKFKDSIDKKLLYNLLFIIGQDKKFTVKAMKVFFDIFKNTKDKENYYMHIQNMSDKLSFDEGNIEDTLDIVFYIINNGDDEAYRAFPTKFYQKLNEVDTKSFSILAFLNTNIFYEVHTVENGMII